MGARACFGGSRSRCPRLGGASFALFIVAHCTQLRALRSGGAVTTASPAASSSALPSPPLTRGVASPADNLPLSGFFRCRRGLPSQVAAVILSSFEEVLYLDSDNVALRDPSDLFRSEGYARTGMILWPDYWPSSAAPNLFEIDPGLAPLVRLNKRIEHQTPQSFKQHPPPCPISVSACPQNGTVESGQLLAHKRRCWAGLLAALFLNLQGPLYYRLLTSYMGAGDKETFPYGMAVARLVRGAWRMAHGAWWCRGGTALDKDVALAALSRVATDAPTRGASLLR